MENFLVYVAMVDFEVVRFRVASSLHQRRNQRHSECRRKTMRLGLRTGPFTLGFAELADLSKLSERFLGVPRSISSTVSCGVESVLVLC